MNEIRKQWVAALLSGKYKQGVGRLRRSDDTYCCMGVLSEVLGLSSELPDDQSCYYYEGESSALPCRKAISAVGLVSPFGDMHRASIRHGRGPKIPAALSSLGIDLEDDDLALTSLNDREVPFSVIADIIEAQPEGLFEDE